MSVVSPGAPARTATAGGKGRTMTKEKAKRLLALESTWTSCGNGELKYRKRKATQHLRRLEKLRRLSQG